MLCGKLSYARTGKASMPSIQSPYNASRSLQCEMTASHVPNKTMRGQEANGSAGLRVTHKAKHTGCKHTLINLNIGHLGFNTLAGLRRRGMLADRDLTPAKFVQAGTKQVCQPCVGELMSPPTRPGCRSQCMCDIVCIWTSVTFRIVGTLEW
jgi:hypothetical protein